MSMLTRTAWIAAYAALTPFLGAQSVTPSEALRILKMGNERFVRGELLEQPLDEGTRRNLARKQSPYAIVVTTADSRVAPEHLFNTGLGELFVIRVAGNVCDQATLASLEFAAAHLGIGLCIVLGHDQCDNLAYLDRAAPTSPAGQQLANRLQNPLRFAARQGFTGPERVAKAAEENVYQTIFDAMQRSSILRHRVHSGRLAFQPARYSQDSGVVTWLPKRRYDIQHRAIAEAEAHRVARVRGLPPHVAMRMLQAGHLRFMSRHAEVRPVTADDRQRMAEGQRPYAVVVADADSRVTPELIFSAGLGELFVIRVAGHFLTDEVLASVEHAVDQTGASLVVVLGHDHSETIELAIQRGDAGGDADLSPSLRAMFQWLEPSIIRANGERVARNNLTRRVSELNSVRFVEALRKRSKTVQRAESEGLIAVLPGLYEVGSGDLHWIEMHDAPAAAPMGETGHGHGRGRGHDDHGHDAHGHGHDDHGHDDHGHADHGHDTHGHDTHGHDAHGAGHGDDSHAAHGHDAHAAHGHDAHGHHGSDGHGEHHDLHSATAAHAEHAAAGTGGHGKPEDTPMSLTAVVLAALAVAAGGVSALMFWSNRPPARREDEDEPAVVSIVDPNDTPETGGLDQE